MPNGRIDNHLGLKVYLSLLYASGWDISRDEATSALQWVLSEAELNAALIFTQAIVKATRELGKRERGINLGV